MMINTDEHYLTLGDINYTNEINSEHTDFSRRFLYLAYWDYGKSSYHHQWFRRTQILQTSYINFVNIHSSYLKIFSTGDDFKCIRAAFQQ